MNRSKSKSRGWLSWWFSDEDSPDERRLLTKLDLLIVPYAILAYWTVFLDQANLNNAYVSGLQQDLGFYGNELVQLQTLYSLGSTIGQIPFAYIFTRLPMFWVIPFLNVAWGVFTLLQYRVTSFAELAAYRFLVGIFESVYFPAVHFVLGAWYRGDEIGRRGGLFYCGLPTGVLTVSFIQAAASANLDGVNGIAGWRWMYIICGVITIPLGFIGYFVLPGTPDKPNRIPLGENDVKLAKSRLARVGHGIDQEFKWSKLKSSFRNWKIWAFVVVDIFFWNTGAIATSGNFLLWLKSLNRYTTSKLNELSAIPPGLGIIYTLFICFSSDLYLGPVWAITLSQTISIVGLVIAVIWTVPEPALWFSFFTNYFSIAQSSALYGWVNSELRANPAERSITLITINILAQSTTIWTPLIFMKTTQAPRYPMGYPFCLACAIGFVISTHVTNMINKRQRHRERNLTSETGSNDTLENVEIVQAAIPNKIAQGDISRQRIPV